MNPSTNANPIIGTDCLAELCASPTPHPDPQSKIRVIEVDVSPSVYNTGHIPGALFWSVYTDLLQPNYRIIEREAFAKLLSCSGIQPDTRVVVYGYAAAMAFWMMAHYGHHRVSFLNGSRTKWTAEDRPLTTETPLVEPARYAVEDLDPVRDDIRVTHQTVLGALGDPDHRFMDVRSIAEYTGERFWPSLPPEGDQRGGHVPGAVLMPIEQTWKADGTFKPVGDLRALYEAAGFSRDLEVITYCAVGGRASQAWFVLTHLLGYPRVRVYDGSWIEWGTLRGVPVEI
ncbi:MAG: sulfurtransferase [Chloroflexi bacterium]|nr:sulfurtransferase [Chloroflexota bacterium]